MSWSAKQYTAFEDERTRPVRDLLSALPDFDGGRVIDLGCGPGNSTEVLLSRYPRAEVSGMDSSEDMILAAKKRLPQVKFELADVVDWTDPGPYDVILANAVFQWVPNHEQVFPGLMRKLRSGGALAIQMPDNLEEPAHRLMRQVALEGPWAEKLRAAADSRTSLASAGWYYELLRPCAKRIDIWRTTYHHVLAGGAAAVVEWFKGSGLRPFIQPLSETERGEYLKRYTAAVAEAYPAQSDGRVLLPFPRLFLVAVS
jgi:trans-aconitate 2-methyltransferase